MRNNGDSYFRRIGSDPVLGTILDVAEINAGWTYDSRDRTLFPTRGGSYRFNLSVAPPFNGVSYAIANLRSQQFVRFDGVPLLEKIPLSLSTDIGYGLALHHIYFLLFGQPSLYNDDNHVIEVQKKNNPPNGIATVVDGGVPVV